MVRAGCLNPLFGGSAFRTHGVAPRSSADQVLIPFLAGLLFGRAALTRRRALRVLIPFLAGLLFGPEWEEIAIAKKRLNPLFGGSAFRTPLSAA